MTVDSVSELSEQMFGASEKLSQSLIEQFGFSNIPTTIPETGHGTLYEVLLWGWLRSQNGRCEGLCQLCQLC